MAVSYQRPISGEMIPKVQTPVVGPRPKKGVMPDAELQALMSGLVTSSVQYIDLELTPDRAKATKYYKGEPFGNEEKGRSQFIVTEVHDSVQAVIPPMVRTVFSNAERAVEFVPRTAASVDQAEQASDYVQYIFAEENNGFLRSVAVMKDGLIRKHGIMKWWWDDTTSSVNDSGEGLTQEQLEILGMDDQVEFTVIRPSEQKLPPGPPDPMTGQPTPPAPLFDAEFVRTTKDGCVKICEMPPEELIVNREARSLEDFIFLGHRTRKTTGELLAMGISQKNIDEHGGDDTSLRDNELQLARQDMIGLSDSPESGESNERHLYVEGYARIDYDGDGKSELRKVCLLGPEHYPVLDPELADDLPLAVWCPDPEPHTLLGGRSWADRTMDLQRLKSSLTRSLLDSAAAAIYPRTWYREGDANLADILNTAIGAPIRTRSGPNAVGEFAHTFMGKELIPVLELANDITERRTGQNQGAVGMDADALQSSTKTAVAAAITSSQEQQEMLVRMFAEGILKPLFKGVLKLLVKYQPRAKVVRLRGKWVDVDPRSWDADMAVTVNVTLGSGLAEEKIGTLMEISAKQESIMQLMGQNNPLVTIKQYRDTLAEMIALRGKKDPSRYFQEITLQQVQQMQQAAASAPPPPDPAMEMVKAQIQLEQQKAQSKLQIDQAKAQADAQIEQLKLQTHGQLEQMKLESHGTLEQMKSASHGQIEQAKADHQAMLDAQKAAIQRDIEQMRLDVERENNLLTDDRERDWQAAQIQLKLVEIEATTGVDLSDQQITAQIERERMQTQAAGNTEKVQSGEKVAQAKLASGESVAQAKNSSVEKVAKTRTTVGMQKKAPTTPTKRRVTINRGPDGKPATYDIEDISNGSK